MTDNQFIHLCKDIVREYVDDHLDKSDGIPYYEVYIVWYCKTLQNWKALASTTLTDGMYYELTLNGDKQELYLDAYKKFENKCIKLKNEVNGMELIDTIEGMTSADYKERFKAEYQQVKIRYNKLHNILEDSKNNKLSFELKSPIELLEQQYLSMYRYLSLLEQRAICEGINLY